VGCYLCGVWRLVAGGLRRSSYRATGGNSEKVWLKQWVKRSFLAVAATTRSPPAPARGSWQFHWLRSSELLAVVRARKPRLPTLPVTDQRGVAVDLFGGLSQSIPGTLPPDRRPQRVPLLILACLPAIWQIGAATLSNHDCLRAGRSSVRKHFF
jgi:hypothetical protein